MGESIQDQLGIDVEALRTKYREERDKRIHPKGNEQYIEVKGDFSRYVDDPYVAPDFKRDPIQDTTDVIIIGGGLGGLIIGARLRQAGVKDIRIIEKGGDFGGTWYWNRYPGAQCDIESYIYLPLLEEIGYIPSEKYSHAPEILAHCNTIGKTFDLYDNACFQTEVSAMRWDDEAALWCISTSRGDEMRAKYVCMSNGPLNRPKLPCIPGIDSFTGHTFHTSRWDYDYTGGGSDGGLTNLADKRVAIIGTGATSVQCVPHLGAAAKELYVFQRTPSSIDVRGNKTTDASWANTLQTGWQQHRMTNFNILVSGGFTEEDLVQDGWTDIIRNLGSLASRQEQSEAAPDLSPLEALELADFQKMEQIRSRVDGIVKDPKTAAALKPYYRQFCKRPCFHDEYLATFNRPNVTLVDTEGLGVTRISENALHFSEQAGGQTNERTFEVDCIIFATGFEVGTNYTRRAGYEIQGRGGIKLSEKWKDGLSSLYGLHTRNFPNCYFMGIGQGGFTANFPHMLNEQSLHITHLIDYGLTNNVRTIEASAAGERGWVKIINEKAVLNQTFFEQCTPGYYNNEGSPSAGLSLFGTAYGGGPEEFFAILHDWQQQGDMKGFDIVSD